MRRFLSYHHRSRMVRKKTSHLLIADFLPNQSGRKLRGQKVQRWWKAQQGFFSRLARVTRSLEGRKQRKGKNEQEAKTRRGKPSHESRQEQSRSVFGFISENRFSFPRIQKENNWNLVARFVFVSRGHFKFRSLFFPLFTCVSSSVEFSSALCVSVFVHV